jgi:DNA-directed RNA polymerase specialized sigma24 family protein
MALDGSITRHIRDLEGGHRREEASRALWGLFFGELVRHALKKLRTMHVARGLADEEDVAEYAFTKVCRGIESGQLKLGDRIDLRRLLLKATEREAIDQGHRARCGGREHDGAILAQVPDEDPGPELLMLAGEGCRKLLDLLGDDVLRRIALWKLAGHTNEEIRRRLNCSLAKVERKLERIRAKWAEIVPGLTASPGPRTSSGPAVEIRDPGDTTAILGGLAGRS